MKTTGLIKNIFLIPLLILILGLTLVNCGDDGWDEGIAFKLYESTNYQNSDPLFGSSVALSGDWVVLGVDSGGASISFYSNNGITWVSTPTLLGQLSTSSIFAVDIDGKYAVLGETDGPSGFVSLYTNDNGVWGSAGNKSIPDEILGVSVAISGTKVIVGAPVSNAFYSYDIVGNALANDYVITNTNVGFGYSVDIDGYYAIVGAYDSGGSTEKAYVFHHDGNNWTNDAPIELSNFAAAGFGCSVAICGDYAIVGALSEYTLAYIYHREGNIWNMVTGIDGDGSNKPSSVSVAISSSYAIVGVVDAKPSYRVNIFGKTSSGSWDNLQTLDVNSSVTPTSINVALDNLHMIVGAGSGSGGQVWFYE